MRLVLRDATNADDAARIVHEVFDYYFAGVPRHDLAEISVQVWEACGVRSSPTGP